jgi:hypothetical protein
MGMGGVRSGSAVSIQAAAHGVPVDPILELCKRSRNRLKLCIPALLQVRHGGGMAA